MLNTQIWYIPILVLRVRMVLFHTLSVRRAMAVAALFILTLSSSSIYRLLEVIVGTEHATAMWAIILVVFTLFLSLSLATLYMASRMWFLVARHILWGSHLEPR